MTIPRCQKRGCLKAAWYRVNRHQGGYYAVRISDSPIYCEHHAHQVADSRALKHRDTTSAHVTLNTPRRTK